MGRNGSSTRGLIIDATIALLDERGFEGTTVALICERCNVAKGTFYYHFKDKDSVVRAFFNRVPEVSTPSFSALMAESDPRERVWMLFESNMLVSGRFSPEVFKALYRADAQAGMRFFNARRTTEHYLESPQGPLALDLIRMGQEVGAIRAGDPEDLIFTQFAAEYAIGACWAFSNGETDCRAEARRAFLTIF